MYPEIVICILGACVVTFAICNFLLVRRIAMHLK